MSTPMGDLLEQLDAEDLERLAARLAPYGREQQSTTVAYTPKSLAAELGRSERSIRAAIARGELEAVKRGRGWLISRAAVADWAGRPEASGVERRPKRRRHPTTARGGVARRALARNP